jgi:hypothetical protein
MISNISKEIYYTVNKVVGFIFGCIKWLALLPIRILGWFTRKIIQFFVSFPYKDFFKKLIFGLFVGVVSGGLITFLRYIPKIALVESGIVSTDEKNHINKVMYRFENVGDSECKKIFGWFFTGKRGEKFSDFNQSFYADVGDISEGSKFVLNFDAPYEEKDNYTILILSYRDANKFRYLINRILGIKYDRIIYSYIHHDRTYINSNKKVMTSYPFIKQRFVKDVREWLEANESDIEWLEANNYGKETNFKLIEPQKATPEKFEMLEKYQKENPNPPRLKVEKYYPPKSEIEKPYP